MDESNDDAGWAAAWAAALDDLELSLDETERLLRGEAPPSGTTLARWAPPVLEGPVPVDLRTRALELHHRQQALIRAVSEVALAMRRQSELTARMSTAPAGPSPVYLDIAA